MAINISEELKKLVELQGIDSQVFKSTEDLEAMPLKIREMDERFKDKTINLKNLEDGVKALQLKRKDKEGEIKTKEEAIKKFQSQMYQVKTNKEYSTFQEEIARAKADISVIEEDVIKILDQTDAENKKVAQEKEVVKNEEARLSQDKKKLQDDAARIKNEIEKLKSARKELAAKVDKDILSKYERILTSRDHRAVVRVDGDSCQGCFRRLPAQVINEIKMKDSLVICENCARILYIEE